MSPPDEAEAHRLAIDTDAILRAQTITALALASASTYPALSASWGGRPPMLNWLLTPLMVAQDEALFSLYDARRLALSMQFRFVHELQQGLPVTSWERNHGAELTW